MPPATVAALVLVAGCSFEVIGVRGDAGATEADAVDAPDLDAPIDALVLGAWTTPVLLPVVNAGDDPTLTTDLLELYSNRSGDIYVATRASANDGFDAPVRVAALSSAQDETTPEVSPDGLTIHFASQRPGGMGDLDIWRSTRASRASPWTTPVLVPELNSPASEAGPNMTPDGRVMVFTSNRGTTGGPDVWMSTRASASDPWGAPVEVVELNTPGPDGSPHVTPDRLMVCLDTTRGTTHDLYCATRGATSDRFDPAAPVVELNSTSVEEDPWLSPDQRHMIFVSNRSGAFVLWYASR